ncbi:unnamed protein product [Peronospora farinosa]|uniref:Complex 1 LYR protein domain-containing protein n=1 Tax=Peronospora farinosa TaxID=134698 RepID=A0AAV0TCJ6_9STRA|nr:unnamed protein product [Peronospora farinosa]CAI5717697.1 unnamed protein product [Peronospora farinosa]
MQLKRSVLHLYTQCLRSARRCPKWEQREMMKVYVQMKFRDEINTKDPDRVKALLADGREELERMNYYHSIYKTKQRVEKTTADATDIAPIGNRRPLHCPQCQVTYSSKLDNFCANCGLKRLECS